MQLQYFTKTLDQKQILYLESMSLKWFNDSKMFINSQNSKPETLNHKWYHIFSSEQSSLVINCEQLPTTGGSRDCGCRFWSVPQSLLLWEPEQSRHTQSLGISADQEHIPCIPSVLSSPNAYSFQCWAQSDMEKDHEQATCNLKNLKAYRSFFLSVTKKKVRGRKIYSLVFSGFASSLSTKKKKRLKSCHMKFIWQLRKKHTG